MSLTESNLTANILVGVAGHPLVADTGLPLSLLDPPATFTVADPYNVYRWMAPEIIILDDPDYNGLQSELHTPKSDIYSLGMTVLEVMTGNVPFVSHKSSPGLLFVIARGDRPQKPDQAIVKGGVWGLISACLNIVAGERPSALTVETWLRTIFT